MGDTNRDEALPYHPSAAVTAGAPFSDINLKIAVLGSLVSREMICLGTPSQLAERVLGRSVDLEREGCALIPEIREYLAAYPLTNVQLGSVETLHLDGGSSIYPYIWYFWDGEDETFDVATFAGIEHCPNITRFVASALVDVVDLGQLVPLRRLRTVRLGVPAKTLEALLDFRDLAEVKLLRGSDLAGEAVISTLKARGVRVLVQ